MRDGLMAVAVFASALVIGIALLSLSYYVIGPIACRARWQGTQFQARWSFFTDCQISLDGRLWIPEEELRVEITPEGK